MKKNAVFYLSAWLISIIFPWHFVSASVISASPEATAAANGMQVLAPDNIAVISPNVVNDGTVSSMLIDGTRMTFHGSGPRTVIESRAGETTYVGTGSDIQTYSVSGQVASSTGDAANIADSDVTEHFDESTSSIPVIIEFATSSQTYTSNSVPNSNSVSAISTRRQRFASTRAQVAGILPKASRLTRDLDIINGVAGTIDRAGLKALENDPNVKRVELDGTAHVFDDASNAAMNVPAVWSLVDGNSNSITGKGEDIAIIDTGVDYTQPDLGGCFGAGCKVIGGYNFISNNANTMDDYGHGTHVASIAAGKGTVNGVAPDADILSYKACDSNGNCPYSAIIEALGYAADPNQDGNTSDHANVANLSFGGPGDPDDAISLAVDNATAAGVVVVVAAGNDGPDAGTIDSPGTARTAITVAASCMSSQISADYGASGYCVGPIASFSSEGPLVWNGVDLSKPDISAPGVDICGTEASESKFTASNCVDGDHILLSGTSMATPQVSGAAALVLQAYPGSTPAQVKQLLKNTATNLGASRDAQGAGLVNVSAAIPLSPHISANPSLWSATTDPTSRYSTSTQTFVVSAAGQGFSTLNASSSFNISGIIVTLHKTSLDVSGNSTDTLVVDVVVDNDIVPAGTYSGEITLSSGGVTEGFIPMFFTVAPTISVSPSPISYGFDNPSLTSWASSSSVTITNLRTDSSQTIDIAPGVTTDGISLTASSSVVIPAGGSEIVPTYISVTNASVSNGINNASTLVFSDAVNSLSIGTTFEKFYLMTIENNDSPQGLNNTILWVNSWVGEQYLVTATSDSYTFYVNTAGPYDVLAMNSCGNSSDGSCHYASVLKEGIDLSSGETTVVESWADASHKVSLKAVDESGNPISTDTYHFNTEDLHSQGTVYTFFVQGTSTEINYYSDFSNNFEHQDIFFTPTVTSPKMYYYSGSFNGLSGDLTYDYSNVIPKRTDIHTDANFVGQTVPILYACYPSGGSCWGVVGPSVNIPTVQTLYSTFPDGEYFMHMTNYTLAGCTDDAHIACNSVFLYPYFNTNGQRLIDQHSVQFPIAGNAVYDGLGPSVWFGKFSNQSNSVDLSLYSGVENALFLRQDYSIGQYNALPYNVTQNGLSVASGTMPAYLQIYATQCCGTSLPSISLTTPGPTKFYLTGSYEDDGYPLTSNVEADFDTTLSDPNPPSIEQLYLYSNGQRSEVFNPAVDNQIVYKLDPVGGTLATTTASISTDGVNFSSISLNASSSAYVADIPAGSIISTGTSTVIQITGADDSGNILKYTFGLPMTSYTDDNSTTTSKSVVPPTISTSTPTSITQTSATLNASIATEGNASSTARGFFWGNTSTYGATTTEIGTFGVGSFSTTLSSLSCGTTYHYAAYAINSAGTTTTGDSSFVTGSCTLVITNPPIVSTSTPTSISSSTATLNANITDSGNASSTVRGFVWGTTSAYGTTTKEIGTFGVGAFSTTLSSLSCGTTYHYAAYAINSAGTTTTGDSSFVTSACPSSSSNDSSSGGGAPVIYSGGGGGGGGGGGSSYTAPSIASSTLVGVANCPVGFACVVNSALASSTRACQNIPGPFDGDLSLNMSGSDVLALQELLSDLDFFTASPTGYFGQVTKRSVISYQTAHKISATGFVGPLTMEALNTDRATLSCPNVQQTNVLGTASSTENLASTNKPVATSSSALTRNLTLGSTGTDVQALQMYLNAHGFIIASSGPGSPYNETTLFGPMTKQALIEFQKANGISATGYFGPITREYISTH